MPFTSLSLSGLCFHHPHISLALALLLPSFSYLNPCHIIGSTQVIQDNLIYKVPFDTKGNIVPGSGD